MNNTTAVKEKKAFTNLNAYLIQPEALRLVPESIARKYNIIPLAVIDNVLQVATSNVDNIPALQEIAVIVKLRIEPIFADFEEIRAAIDSNYKAYHEIEKQLGNFNLAPAEKGEKVDTTDIAEAPVVRALDMIVSEAIKVHASDIHIEPQEDRVRIRFRIDGLLHDIMSLPASVHSHLISRIKILSKMDIADHRPQDGQFSIKVRDQNIDIRVATIETIYGEMGALRILDQTFAALELSNLGFVPQSLRLYLNMLKSPLGMILVSGPTGSGKTTTLYASINSLDKVGRKIITVEDPIEYRFNNINQIQVNPKSGVTFASGLRAIMRHDPNVLLVGEIRDADTSEIATQAALTGHMVLSSVHANDTVGVFLRLMDLGVSPLMICATLLGVISQRIVRRICPYCKQTTSAPPEAQLAYARDMGEEKTDFYYGAGCNFCAGTGYLGRVAIFEIMAMNQDIRSALIDGAGADQLRAIARKSGMVTMRRDGMLKAKQGITTPSEVLRNIPFIE